MKSAKHVCASGAVLLAALVSACGTSTSNNDPLPDPGIPGLGPNPDQPDGTPLPLPASVSIQRVVGADHTDASMMEPLCPVAAQRIAGNEATGVVDVCITFRNDLVTGENPTGVTQLTLPAGVMFAAKASSDPAIPKSQNGLLAQSVTVSLPEGQSRTYVLRLFCTNRAFPSSDRPAWAGDVQTNWEYETVPTQTNYAPLIEVTSILRDRLITWSNAWTVQTAVWDVTEDTDGLSDVNRANLQGLPPRQ